MRPGVDVETDAFASTLMVPAGGGVMDTDTLSITFSPGVSDAFCAGLSFSASSASSVISAASAISSSAAASVITASVVAASVIAASVVAASASAAVSSPASTTGSSAASSSAAATAGSALAPASAAKAACGIWHRIIANTSNIPHNLFFIISTCPSLVFALNGHTFTFLCYTEMLPVIRYCSV